MATLSFRLYDTENNAIGMKELIDYELSKDIGAPCDGLRLRFITSNALPEINRVEAYFEEELLFSGYADTQREERSGGGFKTFIYARSSACLLIDNEAKPYTYRCPSARSLFVLNAERFGFSFLLDDYYCTEDYVVGKGTSCYAAVNNLVYLTSGKSIVITPKNELRLPSGEGKFYINDDKIMQEKRLINRGNIFSQIDFKTAGEEDYNHHIKSRFLEKRGIRKTRKINLFALPNWQRDYTLSRSLMESARDYYAISLTLSGFQTASLYDRAEYESPVFGALSGYYVSGITHIFDERGERSLIKLCKNIDLEEIIYVAEQNAFKAE